MQLWRAKNKTQHTAGPSASDSGLKTIVISKPGADERGSNILTKPPWLPRGSLGTGNPLRS